MCLATGLTALDEAAGLVALYIVIIEFFVYRDLDWKKDLVRIAKASMSLAGAIILILAMANALMNYVVDQHVPTKVLEFMVKIGIEHKWQFLIVMNVFLLVLGMLMEGFSAILVAVPLIVPFVADLGMRHPDEKMSPFQLAMIFLLNLEIAYCMPPLGLNLFISSFRFNRPDREPVQGGPAVRGDPRDRAACSSATCPGTATWPSPATSRPRARRRRRRALPPRDAWMMECVQEDPTNPQPCTAEDRAKYPGGQMPAPATGAAPGTPTDDTLDNSDFDAGCNPDFGPCDGGRFSRVCARAPLAAARARPQASRLNLHAGRETASMRLNASASAVCRRLAPVSISNPPPGALRSRGATADVFAASAPAIRAAINATYRSPPGNVSRGTSSGQSARVCARGELRRARRGASVVSGRRVHGGSRVVE